MMWRNQVKEDFLRSKAVFVLFPVRSNGPERADEERGVGLSRGRRGQQLLECEEEDLDRKAKSTDIEEILQTPHLSMNQCSMLFGPEGVRWQVVDCLLKGMTLDRPSFKNIPEYLGDEANSLEIPHREYKLWFITLMGQLRRLAD